MKISSSVLSLTLVASGVLAGINAFAAETIPEYCKKPFDVTMLSKTVAGENTMRTMCDGKGHVRSEVNSSGQKAISIMDYPASTITSIMEAQKMVMKMPMPKQADPITDADSALKAHAKSLGTKTIDGHPCHGYEVKSEGTTSDTWIGDDIHYLVHSETTSPSGKSTMDLKSYSAKAPDATVFDIPAGYKEMKMPTMPGTAKAK